MKVILFGNTNNYPFRLCQALRRRDVDAHIIINQTYGLHRPEGLHDEYTSGYPDWVHDYSHIGEEDYVSPTSRITPVLNLLDGAGNAILNHIGPSLHYFCSNPGVSLLTGSDLEYYANLDTLDVRAAEWSDYYRRSPSGRLETSLWMKFIHRQRAGIQKSRAVAYFYKGVSEEGDRMLTLLGIEDNRRFTVHFCEIPESPVYDAGNNIPRLFCGARLTWVEPMPGGSSVLDNKRSDLLIRGIGHYYRQTGRRLDIRLVEKGWHVKETRELVESEGLAEQVTWLPELCQSDFRKELAASDIYVDQLGPSFIGMAAMDAMALGKPVIMNIRPEIFLASGKEVPPACHATTAEAVAEHIDLLTADRERRHAIGEKSRQYIIDHMSPEASAEKCIQYLGL